ncbi:hypothetical protein [Maribacter sp. 2307ULW6-5]|uniref:hypothetical protein n=1 Tax=Maribacter sp. 2307ULW6-5 TaxID=3386275 RepID=UPI0039BCD2C2
MDKSNQKDHPGSVDLINAKKSIIRYYQLALLKINDARLSKWMRERKWEHEEEVSRLGRHFPEECLAPRTNRLNGRTETQGTISIPLYFKLDNERELLDEAIRREGVLRDRYKAVRNQSLAAQPLEALLRLQMNRLALRVAEAETFFPPFVAPSSPPEQNDKTLNGSQTA